MFFFRNLIEFYKNFYYRYFPYHYAPFASDFINVRDVSVKFDKSTKPFKPLEQLMAVFPSQSKQFLPIEWQSLMTTKESPIIDFYPLNFCVDLNGKRYEWQGVALLPFVDEKRLHRTLKQVYSTLTESEQRRNKRDYDRLYIHNSSLCYDYLKEIYVKGGNEVTRKSALSLPPMLTDGMAGYVWPDDEDKFLPIGSDLKAPLPNCEDRQNNQVLGVKYRDLSYDDDYIFKAKLLDNVTLPEPTLKPRDYDQSTPYRPNLGFAQPQQFQRDMAPAQRFIRHSMDQQSFYQSRHQGHNNYRPRNQSWSSYQNPRYQNHHQYQNEYSGPRPNYRPRMPQQQYRPYQNNYKRSNSNDGGGSWT